MSGERGVEILMSTRFFRKEWEAPWKPDDPRLLRVAEKIIRLYDLRGINIYLAKPETMAKMIAQELNEDNLSPDI